MRRTAGWMVRSAAIRASPVDSMVPTKTFASRPLSMWRA
jgi:hypothetical protein